MLFYATRAATADAVTVDSLEQQAQSAFIAGSYGAADEKIRAAIGLAGEGDFNRLALLQALIATRMGSDGRSLLGAASAAHDSAAWPRPIISYILGERKLQDVADAERHSGDNMLVKRRHICELTFYAGAFALADAQTRFARQLFEKADQACDSNNPHRAMTDMERAALVKQ
jgi:hypothetical protein